MANLLDDRIANFTSVQYQRGRDQGSAQVLSISDQLLGHAVRSQVLGYYGRHGRDFCSPTNADAYSI